MPSDSDYMARALHLAERGRGRTSPNPLVGAVIVSPEGAIVGSGYHEQAGEAHAEIRALEQAGEHARGATLYCTLEPCCHAGRTGPCAPRVVAAGIARVVAALEDPNPVVAGGGFAYLRAHGVSVDIGVEREAAARLNQPFLTYVRRHRPFVIMKTALSLDGRIAAAPCSRTQVTSGAALRRVHALRAEVDAIAVGSGTILADDPLLTARDVFRSRPLTRVIFDRRLRTPPSARIFSTVPAGPILILTTREWIERGADRASALTSAGAMIEPLERADVASAMTRLAAFEITSVLLEGGAALHRAAWDAGIVDYVQLYIAPIVLGEQGVAWLPNDRFSTSMLLERRVQACGPDVLIEGYVHRPD